MLKLIVRDGWASASQQLLDTAPAGVDMRLCTHLSVLPYEVYAEWERNVDANFAETFGSHSINMILAEGLLRTVDAVQGANGQQLPLQRAELTVRFPPLCRPVFVPALTPCLLQLCGLNAPWLA